MSFLPLLAAAPGGPQMSGWQAQLINLAPLFLIFVVFYFVLIRPQQQRQKKLAEMIGGMAKGDKVVTSGGMVGTVWAVRDNEDTVVIQVADTRLDFLKSAVVQVIKPGK
ncbi:MAG: preprotein translocase subunit YajC [Candidatus Eisenbacteria bacterium]|nr:preprotein translocase subunit YajC [Candidatus Eisenbacteria bacterium]